MPLDGVSEPLVLRRRAACPVPKTRVGRTDGKTAVPRDEYLKQETSYEKDKAEKGIPAGGYLIGRHPECGQCHPFICTNIRLTLARSYYQDTDSEQSALSFVLRKQG